MSLSIAILSMNNDDTLEACLRSVLSSLPANKEVIVVDGHSTDNTPNILAKYKKQIKIVYDKGDGLGWARNTGVKFASSDIVCFVDSDVICSHDHFLKIQECFKNPNIGAVDVEWSSPKGNLTKIQKLETLRMETALHIERKEKRSSGHVWLNGWCICIRKEAFDSVNGFWRTGSDDADFSFKLKQKGIQTAWVKTGSYHIPRATLLSLMKEMFLWGRNWAYWYKKWGNTSYVINDLKNRKLYRIFHNSNVVEIIGRLLSVTIGLNYLLRTKNISLSIYTTVREYIHYLGFIRGNIDILTNSSKLVGVIK